MILTPDDVLAASEAMLRRGEAHVVVSVVWTRAPTSGKAGRKAIVTANGELTGWIGGACSQGAVVRHAQLALHEGRPRVVCVGPETEFPTADENRFVERATCSSKGALELFVEPRMPRPQLVVFGDQPIATVLGTMARALGYEVVAFGQEDRPRPEAHRFSTDLDLSSLTVHDQSFFVVCTMGMFDKAALTAALTTDAPFISLVVSRRRAATILGGLRKAGFSEEQLSRIRAPAGLDLGAIRHEEIAVAVLGEVVKFRAEARAPVTTEVSDANATESVA